MNFIRRKALQRISRWNFIILGNHRSHKGIDAYSSLPSIGGLQENLPELHIGPILMCDDEPAVVLPPKRQ